MVFSTKIIDFISELHNDGANWRGMFTETPFYQGNTQLRNDNISFEFTKEEMAEYVKCSQDVQYFAEKFCKIKREDGSIGNITLRNYQRDYLNLLDDKKYLITLKSRQMGISVVNAIYILHYSIFNCDKTTMIVSNLRQSSMEIVFKIQDMYSNLPFYMKPGIKSWNQTSLQFDNGCKVRTAARSKTPAAGFTIDRFFIEEAAHIPSNILEPFYRSSMFASPNAKISISSTPNGKNFFYTLYTNASLHESDPNKNVFFAHRIDWWLIPSRDDKWKEQTIREIGGQEAFDQEYGLKFTSKQEDRIKTIEDKIDELTKNTTIEELFNIEGESAKFKLPSIAELLKRIEELEKKVENLENRTLASSGDFYKAQKVLEKPGEVTWENIQAYLKRVNDLKWAQHKYGENFDNIKFDMYNNTNLNNFGTFSTPLS